MSNLKIVKNTTDHGKTITVFLPGGSIGFVTLDDCFGMDRVRVWARENGLGEVK